MTIEMTVVCDRCGRVICAARNVSTARKENRRMGGIGPIEPGRDYCPECANRIVHGSDDQASSRGRSGV